MMMDKKKLDIKLDLKNIHISEEQRKGALRLFLHNIRLISIIFLGAVSIYSFNVIFKKAYLEINYIQYPVANSVITASKSKVQLEEVIANMAKRKQDVETIEGKQYQDPFSYRDDSIQAVESESEAALPAGTPTGQRRSVTSE